MLSALLVNPVIAAVRDEPGARLAADSGAVGVFVLGGEISTLRDIIAPLKEAGKLVLIHIDLIGGLGRDVFAVDWCARTLAPDGLISTRSPLLKHAKSLGLITIQRVFLMDSASLQSGMRQISAAPPDMVELLPGLVTKAIAAMAKLSIPVIAGGMVTERPEVEAALHAGARAVSTSNPLLWDMKF